jgi:DNA-binding LacI/PurR family transcriptional regulator
MKRTAKLSDVAKAAGVSQGTASNAFNRPEIVKPEVRERVEAAARLLGYGGPDPRGRLLRAGKVNAIGVVTGDDTAHCFTEPYVRLLMAGIAAGCDAHHAGLAIVPARLQTEAGWKIQTALVDGFIVLCLGLGDELVELARERKLPLVSIDLDTGPGTSSILIDDRRGAYLAARHLLDLGHRALAIVSIQTSPLLRLGPVEPERLRASEFRFERDRAAGYAAALEERGLALEDLKIVETPNERRAAERQVAALLEAHPEVTAVLALSDVLAFGAIDAARARGLRVPEDLSVVGFDDIAEAAACVPPLTTVAQPAVEKGRRAAQLVFEVAAAGTPRCEVLEVSLVVRGSTAPPRG